MRGFPQGNLVICPWIWYPICSRCQDYFPPQSQPLYCVLNSPIKTLPRTIKYNLFMKATICGVFLYVYTLFVLKAPQWMLWFLPRRSANKPCYELPTDNCKWFHLEKGEKSVIFHVFWSWAMDGIGCDFWLMVLHRTNWQTFLFRRDHND